MYTAIRDRPIKLNFAAITRALFLAAEVGRMACIWVINIIKYHVAMRVNRLTEEIVLLLLLLIIRNVTW